MRRLYLLFYRLSAIADNPNYPIELAQGRPLPARRWLRFGPTSKCWHTIAHRPQFSKRNTALRSANVSRETMLIESLPIGTNQFNVEVRRWILRKIFYLASEHFSLILQGKVRSFLLLIDPFLPEPKSVSLSPIKENLH